jgi:hypothetical protein
MTAKFLRPALCAAAIVALAACGSPEKAAEKAMADADAKFQKARVEMDPEARVKAIDAVVKEVEAIGKKYAKTPAGAAIANGTSVGGMSSAAMIAMRDRFAARAGCYKKPTAECLEAFAPDAGGVAAYENSPEAAFAKSQKAACTDGVLAADKELAGFKINKPVYAQQLLQVALAAARCDKPEAVKAAMSAYWAVEPAQGNDRLGAQLSVLATDSLEPAAGPVLADLEAALASGGLDPQTQAQIALAMAGRYAAMGEADKALAKWTYFTDTLNFEADFTSKREFAASLVMAGNPDAALKILDAGAGNTKSLQVMALNDAAARIGRRLGVVREGAALPATQNLKSMAELMKAVDGDVRTRYSSVIRQIEAEFDKLAPVVTLQDHAIGFGGVDTGYGVVALVRQKLGDAEGASDAMAKAQALRGRVLATGAEGAGRELISEHQAALALAQGDLDAAAGFAKLIPVRHDYTRLILAEVGARGEAEKALTLANELGAGQDFHTYSALADALAGAGKVEKAEAVINAFPGGGDQKQALQWTLVNRLANEGDIGGAEAAATKYNLLNSPGDKFRLLNVSINSEKVAKVRGKAEPILREMFAIGEELDAGRAAAGGEDLLAESAATYAFRNGYDDLGFELYEKASRKDQRPLFAALRSDSKPADITRVLMLAEDNLGEEARGYVVNAAARALQK